MNHECGWTTLKAGQIWTHMNLQNKLQKTDTYGDPVQERHVYLLQQKKTVEMMMMISLEQIL